VLIPRQRQHPDVVRRQAEQARQAKAVRRARETAARRKFALRVASEGAYDLLVDVATEQVATRAARSGGAR